MSLPPDAEMLSELDRLVDSLVRLRLVQAAGIGLWVQSLSLGKLGPRPETHGQRVTLRLFDTGGVPSNGIARDLLGKAAYTRMRGLNPIRYAEMVREYLKDHPTIANREIRELLGLGESPTAQVEVSRYLRRWTGANGFLVREGVGAQRRYRLRKGV